MIGSLDRPPRPGQRIRLADDGVVFVTEVLRSGIAIYTVECVGQARFHEELRQRSVLDIASLLRVSTRPVITLQSDEAVSAASRSYRNPFQDWIEIYLAKSAERRANAGASAPVS